MLKNKTTYLAKLCSIVMLTLLLAAPFAHAQDITTGLIGHWKLDETTGTTAADSAGSNNGTMSGGLDAANDSIAGKMGNALSFDGVNDYVDLGDISAVEGVTALSVSVWVKNNKTFIDNTGVERIVAKVGGGLDTFDMAWQQSEDIYFGVQDNVGSWAYGGYVDGIPAGSGNQWHHVVGVYDGSNVYVYVNGVAGGVTPALTDATNNTAHVVTIADPDGTSDGWDGIIDDVRIYNRALTTADITALYEGTTPGSIRYNNASEAIEYHSGTEWVHAGLGSYAPNGVEFDGTSDYLSTGTDLTGINDTKKVTGSLWFRKNVNGSVENIYQSITGTPRFNIDVGSGGSVRLRGYNSSNTQILGITSSITTADTDWHHFMFSVDMADTSKRHFYIDGTNALPGSMTYTDDFIDVTGTDHRVATNTNGFEGDLADFWLDFGTYIDLSVAANREKFLSASSQPMYLGADGSLPLGKQPDVFLSGDTADWHTNKGSGGGFTENGALTDALDTPFAATWRSASTTNVQKFASDAAVDDYLGGYSAFGSVNSVSVSGMYAAVGAPGVGTAGAVYIFHTETGAELHKIDAPGGSDINFGTGVAIEGNNLVVGAPGNCGADLYVYDINKSTTTPQVSITGGLNNCNGWDVDISGDKFIAGTRNGNAATVYDINDGTLLHTLTRTTAGSFNGYGVAIDGDWAIVGNSAFNSNEGRAYIYDLSACGASCNETHLLTASDAATGDQFGHGVEIDGDYAAVGAPGNARVYTFDVKTGTELQIIAPTASSGDAFADFGANITIDNKVMAVSQGRGGTSRTGRFEVFDVVSGTSLYALQNPTGTPSEDRFAWMIGMDDDVIVAGHPYEDTAASNAGSAWIITMKPCASPDGRTGDILYNDDDKVMQYCNGRDWVAMGPVSGSGGNGCFDPTGSAGDIIFNTDYSVLQYCNDEDWVGIGTGEDSTTLSGLVHHWPLDETSGSSITDIVGGLTSTWSDGSGNDVAEETTAGKVGTALDFDGSDDFVSALSFDPPHQGTISFWLRPDNIETANVNNKQRIMGGHDAYEIVQRGCTGATCREIGNDAFAAGTGDLVSGNIAALSNGNWIHVVSTYDFNTNATEIYINGSIFVTGSTADDDPGGPFSLRIGHRTGAPGSEYFDGTIDDVRIYDRVLTAPQILDLYQSGNNFQLTDNLAAHWTLDETTGSSIADSAGSNTGTWADGTGDSVAEETTAGKVGTAITFDGTDDKISVGTPAALNGIFAGGATLATWVDLTTIPASSSRLIDRNQGGSGNGWLFGVDAGGQLRFDRIFSGNNGSWTSPASSVTTGQWVHVAVTYDEDSTSNDAVFYVNGVSAGSVTEVNTPTGSASNDSSDVIVVGNRNASNRPVDGDMDDVRIYDRVLTAGEILTLYNETK